MFWKYHRELLLLTGITSHGLGNWKKIAEHIGTRTKGEVEEHYNGVYVESPDWPVPVGMSSYITDVQFRCIPAYGSGIQC